MTPTCATCRYFVPDLDDVELDENHEEIDPDIDETGTCHFHAPQPVMYCFLPQKHEEELLRLRGLIEDCRAKIGSREDVDYQSHIDAALEEIERLEEDVPGLETIWPAVDAEDYCGSYKMIDRKGKK